MTLPFAHQKVQTGMTLVLPEDPMPPDDGQESPFCLHPMWIRLILKLKAQS
jgi:hypothetical protein